MGRTKQLPLLLRSIVEVYDTIDNGSYVEGPRQYPPTRQDLLDDDRRDYLRPTRPYKHKDPWYTVCGTYFQVYSVKYVVYGIQYTVHGI